MPSLMEIVERVNKGDLIDSGTLEVYEDSPNSAEKFLAHHAHAMLDLRQAQQHLMQSLDAIDYSDQKVLNQFVSITGFLGLNELRAAPVVKFGASAIARRDYALGLEAIQSGVSFDLAHGGSFTTDRENCQFVATQYERAAQAIGWTSPTPPEWNNKLTKIALVVSSIADDESSGRLVRSLSKAYDSKRFKLMVYSTESAVRRDKQQFAQNSYAAGSAKRGAATLDVLNRQKVQSWLAPTDGDSVSAAKAMAEQLVKDRVDVVIFDTNQSDPIAVTIANWPISRVKINLCRRAPMYVSGLDCVTYLDQVRYEMDKDFWQRKGVESRFLLEGIDTEEDLGAMPQRSAYGIPEQAMVLATAGNDLDNTMSPEFVDSVINILRAHPHAIYLLIGDGELAWQKRKFESAGVGKRVGYAGKRKDLPGFLRIADLYLAEFPSPSASGVLQAMSVEKPVVAMRWGDSTEQSQAASFVGSEGTLSGRDPSAYIERVSKIIRDASYRQKLGKTMRERILQHFAFAQTARHLEELCDQLIQRHSESTANVALKVNTPEPMAEVA